jgi:two-component system, OmpR family, KDP operon response regulator KdpE
VSARVLIVDRNPQLVLVLGISLRQQGYQTDAAADGRCALAAAARQPPALVVLDLYPPDLTGVEVIRRLRRWSRAPILVLSGRARTGDTVAALDAGADDYVTKPFDMDELLARVRALARRAGRTQDIAQVRIGEHTVDLARRLVTGQPGGVTLTPIEWEILEVLIRHTGRLVSQTQLLNEVGGSAYLKENRSLRVHMAHLRRKLERDPARPLHLQTEPGMGYRFSA